MTNMSKDDVEANLVFEHALSYWLENWEPTTASELSLLIHKFETEGGEVTDTVDILRMKLSQRLGRLH